MSQTAVSRLNRNINLDLKYLKNNVHHKARFMFWKSFLNNAFEEYAQENEINAKTKSALATLYFMYLFLKWFLELQTAEIIYIRPQMFFLCVE